MALDLKKLEEKFNNSFSKETEQSFNEWVQSKLEEAAAESPVEAAVKDVFENWLIGQIENLQLEMGLHGKTERIRTRISVYREVLEVYKSKTESSRGEQGQEEACREAAEILYKKHNPHLPTTWGMGSKLLSGFYKDMEYISKHYHLTKKS